MTVNGYTKLEMLDIVWNGWKFLEKAGTAKKKMAKNGKKWLDMVGIAVTGWKGLEINENVCNFWNGLVFPAFLGLSWFLCLFILDFLEQKILYFL